MSKTPRFVTLCPNCGSNNWHQENETVYTGDQGFYVCNKCNFSSRLFPEVEISNKDNFKKETKKGHFRFKTYTAKKFIPSLLLFIIAIAILLVSWVLFVILFGIIFTFAAIKRIIFKK